MENPFDKFDTPQHANPFDQFDALPGGAATEPPGDPTRALQVGVQGVGRGLSDLIGAPFDITNMLVDTIMSGVDLTSQTFGGPEIPFRFGRVSIGDTVADMASSVAETAGLDLVDPATMTSGERLAYNVNRFGTEALSGGAGFARAAGKRFAEGATALPKAGDAFLRPYADDAMRTLRGDAAGGAGAGTLLTASQENDLGPAGDFAAMLIGGVGGSGALSAVENLPRTVRNTAERFIPDANIPVDPHTGAPVMQRTTRRAATMAQRAATDPVEAANTIERRIMDAHAAGDPVATSGLLSDDIGLISAEQAVRMRDRVPFIEQDRRLTDAASERVSGLRDEGADIAEASRAAQARPGELAAIRDADALPLLRQAEASGATVDAAPVAALIDSKLETAKRAPVRAALTEARKMLNKAGSDELDNSVSGLYETRKAINDIIEGRGENATGRFAKSELIEVRDALDEAITAVAPEFGDYLKRFREGSKPLDELRQSGDVARLMEDDPRNVANRLLSGQDFASADRMRDVTNAVSDKPEAKRAWRAAVSEVLSRKVRNVGGAVSQGGTEGPVSIAKLRRVWNDHEDALSGVYSPEDMETLRRTHEMLAPLENRRTQATVGSATAENQMLRGAWDAFGTAMMFRYGAVPAGMIVHRARRALNMIPNLEGATLDNKALNLINRMWFDPDIAVHVLRSAPEEVAGPRWNARLNQLLAAGELARGEDEPERGPLEITVTPSREPEIEDIIMGP